MDTVVVCDVRMHSDSGEAFAEYSARHLPGARFVDLNADLAAPAQAVHGRHPLPTAEHFAAVLGRLGIDEVTNVVAYDNAAGALASRLVWMIRVTGGSATVLEGGSAEWEGPFAAGPVHADAVARSVQPWPAGRIVDGPGVEAAIGAGRIVIDSRAPERFRGEVEPLDRVAGHIPGAVNLPFTDHLEGGRLTPVDQITARFAEAGVDGSAHTDRPIVYCGSGVTACFNILIAEYAGLGELPLYVGSWSGWSTTPEAPIAAHD